MEAPQFIFAGEATQSKADSIVSAINCLADFAPCDNARAIAEQTLELAQKAEALRATINNESSVMNRLYCDALDNESLRDYRRQLRVAASMLYECGTLLVYAPQHHDY